VARDRAGRGPEAGNQIDPFGRRYPATGRRDGTFTGNWDYRRAHIICDLDPRWQRDRRYERLFFLDEATALAAGFRPCHRCRRAAKRRFDERWAAAHGGPADTAEIDAVLRTERDRTAPGPEVELGEADLADGAIVERDGIPLLVVSGTLLAWSPTGYTIPTGRAAAGRLRLVTPTSTLAVIAAGYRPELHPSAIQGAPAARR